MRGTGLHAPVPVPTSGSRRPALAVPARATCFAFCSVTMIRVRIVESRAASVLAAALVSLAAVIRWGLMRQAAVTAAARAGRSRRRRRAEF